MSSGDEAAAIALLKRAVELDSANRLTEVGGFFLFFIVKFDG